MSPSARRWVIGIGALDVVLFVALIIALATQGPATTTPPAAQETSSPAVVATAGPTAEASTEPAPTEAVTEAATREVPAGALSVADFTLPSKNISCSLSLGEATCWIASASFTPPGPAANCQWYGQVVTLSVEGVALPCPDEQPRVGAEGITILEYGQSTAVGAWLCTSSDRGVECSSLDDGTGFTLARASLTTYGPGRIV